MKTLILSSFVALNIGSASFAAQEAQYDAPQAAYEDILLPNEAHMAAQFVQEAAIAEPIAGPSPYEKFDRLNNLLQANDINELDKFFALYPELGTLQFAITHHNIPLVEYLLSKKTDAVKNPELLQQAIEERYNHLYSISTLYHDLDPISLAAIAKTAIDLLVIIKLLINHGANIEEAMDYSGYDDDDYETMTPLLKAVENADYELVAFLTEQGANVNAINFKGKKALDIARESLRLRYKHFDELKKKNFNKIIALLENYKTSRLENRIFQQDRRLPVAVHSLIAEYATGAQGSSKQSKAQRIALHAVKEGFKIKSIEPLEDFIKAYPKELNAQDEASDSLLLLAIKSGNVAAVRLILETLTQLDTAEKNVNERLIKAVGHTNAYGKNAYDVAQESHNNEIIELVRPHYNAPASAPE